MVHDCQNKIELNWIELKDTKSDFLSQILRKLWGIEYLARLAQTAISFFYYMTENLLKGAGVALFWFSFIWYVK